MGRSGLVRIVFLMQTDGRVCPLNLSLLPLLPAVCPAGFSARAIFLSRIYLERHRRCGSLQPFDRDNFALLKSSMVSLSAGIPSEIFFELLLSSSTSGPHTRQALVARGNAGC